MVELKMVEQNCGLLDIKKTLKNAGTKNGWNKTVNYWTSTNCGTKL